MPKRLVLLLFIVYACESQGNLKFLSDLSNDLKEVSAAEMYSEDDVVWLVEDSGNSNTIYAVNQIGARVKSIALENVYNRDWEDLSFDLEGNLYVGDFGNNNKTRTIYSIYKIDKSTLNSRSAKAQVTDFYLPTGSESKDFEAFFVWNDHFYVFSKEKKELSVYRIPNKVGRFEAELVSMINLQGKGNKITSADISTDGKMVVLLTHSKLWKLYEFNSDNFFSGRIEQLEFKHDSQKEGVCIKTDSTVVITDERTKHRGGNIYEFTIN